MCHAGIVDEDIDGGPLSRGGAGQRVHAGGIGDIAAHGARLAAALFDRFGHSLDAVEIAGGDDDGRAAVSDGAGDGGADALATARDHGRHPSELHAWSSARTASSSIPPSTSIVRRPSSALAAAGSPK